MSTILHLVRHDIRALRLPLLAWVALLLAQALMVAFGPALIEPEGLGGWPLTFTGFLAGARLAFTILFTVLLIQRDPPVGTTAFWLTRPIPPPAMAMSKLCSAALLLVALPVVTGWTLFSVLGLAQGDVLAGVWRLAVEQTLIVGLSTMGAAVTATIPQFAVAAVAGSLLIGAVSSQARTYVDNLPALQLPGVDGPLVTWASITVPGAIALLAYQYSRRRVFRTAVGVIVVLTASLLGALAARTSVGVSPAKPLQAGILDPGTVSVRAAPDTVRAEWGTTYGQRGTQGRSRYASAILRTDGAPPAIVLQPWSIESVWHPQNAPAVHWRRLSNAAYRRGVPRMADADGQPFESIAGALGSVELLRPARQEPSAFHATLVGLPEAALTELASPQGPLDATLTLRAWRYRIVDAAPLAAGSTVSARQGRLTVRAVARTQEGVQVDVSRVFLQRFVLTEEDVLGAAGIPSAERLLIRNISRKQAVLLTAETSRQFSYSFSEGLSSVQLGTGSRRLRFWVSIADGSRATIDDDWLAGAELIVLRPEDLGAFTRPLRVEWVNLETAK
jgi:hypothetical protein